MTLQQQLDLFPAWFWFLFFCMLTFFVIAIFVMLVKTAQKGAGKYCDCGSESCKICKPGKQ